MAIFDFTPLYRSSIGFDQLPGLLAHAAQRDETGFPPYNIEKMAEDQYRIILAVAGFTQDDIEIVHDRHLLPKALRPRLIPIGSAALKPSDAPRPTALHAA
jgi:molecular chaperone IbpA